MLLLLLAFALDFGRLFFTYVQVNNAAREGANQGASSPTNHVAILGAANREKSGQLQRGESTITVTETCADAVGTTIACAVASGGTGPGNTITVNVQTPFTFLTPIIGSILGNNLQLNASATASVLGYAASAGGPVQSPCGPPTNVTFVPFTSGLSVTVDPTGSAPEAGVCAISGYNYDFGDGTTDVGTSIPITHDYDHPGTYTIELEVTNQGGNATTTRTVTVPAAASPPPSSGPSSPPSSAPSSAPSASACVPPVANFAYANGNPNKKVTFTDTSTTTAGCPITTWHWEFGDGSPDSNAPNPVHTYPNNNASYSATLTVTTSAGTRSITRQVNT